MWILQHEWYTVVPGTAGKVVTKRDGNDEMGQDLPRRRITVPVFVPVPGTTLLDQECTGTIPILQTLGE